MATLLKHIALYTIAGLLLFNTVGCLIFLRLNECAIEERFETALKTGKIKSSRIVKFTNADLVNAVWQNNHEIELNGMYYDLVATKQNSNGLPVFEFITDEDETELFDKYKSLFKKNAKSKNIPPPAFFCFYYTTERGFVYTDSFIQSVITPCNIPPGQSHLRPPYSPPKV